MTTNSIFLVSSVGVSRELSFSDVLRLQKPFSDVCSNTCRSVNKWTSFTEDKWEAGLGPTFYLLWLVSHSDESGKLLPVRSSPFPSQCVSKIKSSQLTFPYLTICSRMEMYCRELTERFEDVWVVSGPLTLPQTNGDGKKSVTYQVCTYAAGIIEQ